MDTPENLPLILRKKELRILLGNAHSRSMEQIMIHDGVLKALSIDLEEYKRIRTFSPRQTRIIYEKFGWVEPWITNQSKEGL